MAYGFQEPKLVIGGKVSDRAGYVGVVKDVRKMYPDNPKSLRDVLVL